MGESNIMFFSLKGTSLPLAKNVAHRLDIQLGAMKCEFFSNKGDPDIDLAYSIDSTNAETKLEIEMSVRNKDVYVLQVLDGEPNDCIMQLLMMCYALKTACCRKVIGVVPYLPYSKQSKMRNRGAIPAKLMAQLLCRAGLNQLITMDLHSKEVQGYYDCPVDNLRASPFLIQYIQDRIPGYQNAVIVARHPTSAARANSFAERLQLNIAVLHGEHSQEDSEKCDGRQSPPVNRRRCRSNLSESMEILPPGPLYQRQISNEGYYNLEKPCFGLPTKVKKPLTIVGDVTDKIAIIVEDIIDDATVLVDAASLLYLEGAIKIYVVATHGLFSGEAPQLINDSYISEVIVSNSVPVENKLILCPKIRIVDISPVISEAVRRIHNGESMSYLFRNIPLED